MYFSMPKIGGRPSIVYVYFLCEIFLTANAYCGFCVCKFNDVELEMAVWDSEWRKGHAMRAEHIWPLNGFEGDL